MKKIEGPYSAALAATGGWTFSCGSGATLAVSLRLTVATPKLLGGYASARRVSGDVSLAGYFSARFVWCDFPVAVSDG